MCQGYKEKNGVATQKALVDHSLLSVAMRSPGTSSWYPLQSNQNINFRVQGLAI